MVKTHKGEGQTDPGRWLKTQHRKGDGHILACLFAPLNSCTIRYKQESRQWKGLLSAIIDTTRFTGIGRLTIIFSAMACCLIQLLMIERWWWMLQLTCSMRQSNEPEHTRVGCQSCNRNPNMIIYPEHLLLVGGEFACGSLCEIDDEFTGIEYSPNIVAPSAPGEWHGSLNVSPQPPNLALRLQERIPLGEVVPVVKKQCYPNHTYFETANVHLNSHRSGR